MRKETYKISTTTPIFSYGADSKKNDAKPDIRATSIRGMVRWWFKALNKEAEANEIMGRCSNSGVSASKVIFRVVKKGELPVENNSLLPHKKMVILKSIKPGVEFELQVIERFKLQDQEWDLLKKVIRTWLMLGALGMRSTRGGGCVYDSAVSFNSREEWLQEASALTEGSKIKVYISRALDNSLFELRKFCTDTVRKDCLGSANPRKESPLRFKIVKIKGKYHIAFINDTRKENVLEIAISVLQKGGGTPKEIGKLLQESVQL